VYDSTWEATESFELDRNPAVAAWVKNDHLGFEILYVYRGVVRKYRPDFLIRLTSGEHLVVETKGQDTEQDQVKRRFLDEWIRAVNQHAGFGCWHWAVSKHPGDLPDILTSYKKDAVA
jgi:type III restriction enzyme